MDNGANNNHGNRWPSQLPPIPGATNNGGMNANRSPLPPISRSGWGESNQNMSRNPNEDRDMAQNVMNNSAALSQIREGAHDAGNAILSSAGQVLSDEDTNQSSPGRESSERTVNIEELGHGNRRFTSPPPSPGGVLNAAMGSIADDMGVYTSNAPSSQTRSYDSGAGVRNIFDGNRSEDYYTTDPHGNGSENYYTTDPQGHGSEDYYATDPHGHGSENYNTNNGIPDNGIPDSFGSPGSSRRMLPNAVLSPVSQGSNDHRESRGGNAMNAIPVKGNNNRSERE